MKKFGGWIIDLRNDPEDRVVFMHFAGTTSMATYKTRREARAEMKKIKCHCPKARVMRMVVHS